MVEIEFNDKGRIIKGILLGKYQRPHEEVCLEVDMLTQKVRKYIEEHKLCADYLFDDWAAFLELLYAQGGCVESILWFEHVCISEQKHSLGAGGYRDKSNPNYMYAETHLFRDNLANKSLFEVKRYIQSVIAAYPHNVLIPSFYIAE